MGYKQDTTKFHTLKKATGQRFLVSEQLTMINWFQVRVLGGVHK